jgi:hypothetical protein
LSGLKTGLTFTTPTNAKPPQTTRVTRHPGLQRGG